MDNTITTYITSTCTYQNCHENWIQWEILHKNANLLHSQKGLLQLSIDLNFCQWVVQILQIFWKHLTIWTIDTPKKKKNLKTRQHNYVNMEKAYSFKGNSLIFKTIPLWYSSHEFINTCIINKLKKKPSKCPCVLCQSP